MLKSSFDTLTRFTGLNYPIYYCYGKWCNMTQSRNDEPNVSEVTDKLYISDLGSAFNYDELKKIGITHIINVVPGISNVYQDNFTYLYIPVRDVNFENIQQYFEETNNFITTAIKDGGKVLVHCKRGASRSATLVAAYIIFKGKGRINNVQAIEYLQKKRDIINPNDGFMEQLNIYYNKIKEENLEMTTDFVIA